MNNAIKAYQIGILVQPKPSIILTYSYLEMESKRRKRLMPVRDLENLKLDLTGLDSIDLFMDIIKNLKERHQFYLNEIDDLILTKIIIILSCLINDLELEQSLLFAENLLKKTENGSAIKENVQSDLKTSLIKSGKKKKDKRQVRFKEDHEEFIFEKDADDDLIENLNDKDFLDTMFKNESSYEEDLNNQYETVNYNKK